MFLRRYFWDIWWLFCLLKDFEWLTFLRSYLIWVRYFCMNVLRQNLSRIRLFYKLDYLNVSTKLKRRKAWLNFDAKCRETLEQKQETWVPCYSDYLAFALISAIKYPFFFPLLYTYSSIPPYIYTYLKRQRC